MVLSARTLQIIWIASFATGMLFFVLQYTNSQGYIPKSPEAWLFFLLGWSFIVVAAVSAGSYWKKRTSALHRTTTKEQTCWNVTIQRINKPWFISLRALATISCRIWGILDSTPFVWEPDLYLETVEQRTSLLERLQIHDHSLYIGIACVSHLALFSFFASNMCRNNSSEHEKPSADYTWLRFVCQDLAYKLLWNYLTYKISSMRALIQYNSSF